MNAKNYLLYIELKKLHFFVFLLNIHLREETERVPRDVDAETGGCGGCVDEELLAEGSSASEHVWTSFGLKDGCDDDGILGGGGNCADKVWDVLGSSVLEHVATCFGVNGS